MRTQLPIPTYAKSQPHVLYGVWGGTRNKVGYERVFPDPGSLTPGVPLSGTPRRQRSWDGDCSVRAEVGQGVLVLWRAADRGSLRSFDPKHSNFRLVPRGLTGESTTVVPSPTLGLGHSFSLRCHHPGLDTQTLPRLETRDRGPVQIFSSVTFTTRSRGEVKPSQKKEKDLTCKVQLPEEKKIVSFPW